MSENTDPTVRPRDGTPARDLEPTIRQQPRSPSPTTTATRSVAWFVGLTLAMTAGAAALAGVGVVPQLLPFVLAIGPAVIAVALARREGRGTATDLLASLRRRPTRTWALALVLPVLATLAVIPIAVAQGQASAGLFDKVFPAILIVPFVVAIPAFAEELAWRGFALGHLLRSMSPARATLILAVPWAALHLALFLPGQMYEGIAVWPSIVGVGSLAVILSWLYVRTGGSVLLTGLFHALFNGVTPLTSGVDTGVSWELRALLVAGVAVAVVVGGGLGRRTAVDARSSAAAAGTAAA